MSLLRTRRRTAAQWASANPVMPAGQVGGETDLGVGRSKIGDGSTPWNSLPYQRAGSEVLVPGIVGDGVTDESAAIQNLVGQMDAGLIPPGPIAVQAPIGSAGSVYINSLIRIRSDGITLRFASPVIFGPAGMVKLTGDVVTTSSRTLAANVASNDTTITLTSGSVAALGLVVGSVLSLHGNRDAYGNALWHETVVVTALAGDVVTIQSGVENSYNTSYSNSYGTGNAYNTVSSIAARALGATAANVGGNAARGTNVIQVDSSADFVVGDVVMITDSDVDWDPRSNVTQPSDTPNHEMAVIDAIADGTHVQIDHFLHHDFDVANHTQLTKLNPITNSAIEGVRATFTGGVHTGSKPANYPLYMAYAYNCHIRDTDLTGTGPNTSAAPWGNSWYGVGVMMRYSFKCSTWRTVLRNPAVTSSGKGYGVGVYSCTDCLIDYTVTTACRHDVVLSNGSCGIEVTRLVSTGTGYSAADCHGSNNYDCTFDGVWAIGGSVNPMSAWSTGSGPTFDTNPSRTVCRAGDDAHVPGDRNIVFRNVTAVNFHGSVFQVVADSKDVTCENFRAINCTNVLRLTAAGGAGQGTDSVTILRTNGVIVRNGSAHDLTGSPIDVHTIGSAPNTAAAYIDNVVMEDVRFVRPQVGITVGSTAATPVTSLSLDNIAWEQPALAAGAYGLIAYGVTSLRIRGGNWSKLPNGLKLTNCANFRVSQAVLGGYTDAGNNLLNDNGGNAGGLFAANAYIDSPIIMGANTSGLYLSDLPVPAGYELPSRHHLSEWSYDPAFISSTSSVMTSGTVYLVKLWPMTSGARTTLCFSVLTAASGVTDFEVAVFSLDLTTRLATTSVNSSGTALTTAVASTGVIKCTLSSFNVTAGVPVYVAFIAVGGTPPALGRAGVATNGNANLGGPSTGESRYLVGATAKTAMPAGGDMTLTGTATGSGALTTWAALGP